MHTCILCTRIRMGGGCRSNNRRPVSRYITHIHPASAKLRKYINLIWSIVWLSNMKIIFQRILYMFFFVQSSCEILWVHMWKNGICLIFRINGKWRGTPHVAYVEEIYFVIISIIAADCLLLLIWVACTSSCICSRI